MGTLQRRDIIDQVRLLSFTLASLWVLGLFVALGQQGSGTDQSESEIQKKKPSPGKVESRTEQQTPAEIIPERDPNSEPGPINESVVPESLVTPLIVPFGNMEGSGGEGVGEQEAAVKAQSLDEEQPIDREMIEKETVDSLASSEEALETAPDSSSSSAAVGLSSRNTGFVSRTERVRSEASDSLSEGFVFSSYSEFGYDSNPSFGFGSESLRGGDTYLLLGGEVGFLRRVGDLGLDLSYYGDYQRYSGQSDLNNDYHEVDLAVGYERDVLSVSLDASLTSGSGANAYYQSLVEEKMWNVTLQSAYELSALTKLRARYDYQDRNAAVREDVLPGVLVPTVNDVSGHTVRFEALWSYSSLLQIGPALRASTRSGSGTAGRLRSVGPGLSVDYKASTVVALEATAALNWYDIESGGGGDRFISASIGATYRTSPLWSLKLGIGRDLVASSSDVGTFTERTYGRLKFRRQVGRNSLTVGASCYFDDYIGVNGAGLSGREYYSCDLAVGRTVFEASDLSVFVKYGNLSANQLSNTDSLVVGFSLDHKF